MSNLTNADKIEIVKKWYVALKFPKKFDEEFEKLLHDTDMTEGENIFTHVFLQDENDRGENLLACLYFCEELERSYEKRGIPKTVLFDTLRDLPYMTNIHYTRKGRLGVTEPDWVRKILEFNIFRLGRLQFGIEGCRKNIPDVGAIEKDTAIAIHVPRGNSLDINDCLQSIQTAKEFYEKYFPEVNYKCFTCDSWLLDKSLINFIKQDSNIIKFQQLFTEVSTRENYSILRFCVAWDATNENITDYSPANPFTEKIISHIQNGGKFYKTFGYIER